MEKSKTKIFRVSGKRFPKVKKHENSSEDTYTNLKMEAEQENDSESWSIESNDEKENDFLKWYSESNDSAYSVADTDIGSNNEILEESENDDHIAGDSL